MPLTASEQKREQAVGQAAKAVSPYEIKAKKGGVIFPRYGKNGFWKNHRSWVVARWGYRELVVRADGKLFIVEGQMAVEADVPRAVLVRLCQPHLHLEGREN